jgi:hypothetical protein
MIVGSSLHRCVCGASPGSEAKPVHHTCRLPGARDEQTQQLRSPDALGRHGPAEKQRRHDHRHGLQGPPRTSPAGDANVGPG